MTLYHLIPHAIHMLDELVEGAKEDLARQRAAKAQKDETAAKALDNMHLTTTALGNELRAVTARFPVEQMANPALKGRQFNLEEVLSARSAGPPPELLCPHCGEDEIAYMSAGAFCAHCGYDVLKCSFHGYYSVHSRSDSRECPRCGAQGGVVTQPPAP